ncbi:hypothetical protein LEN26_010929 [Aphanomyces euteiches]|nr:hypothetical protein LEN26_010929 [Aphanomyces euteiches]
MERIINVHGKAGGKVESDEFPTYPQGHVYVVQQEAWMDDRVWHIYLQELLKYELVAENPSVTLADNLNLCANLEPLPLNLTSVCQPLDAGVMGPLKSKLRSLWLKEKPVVTAAEKRMMMIKRTITAWSSLSNDVIK